jgi:hypothetical protein
MDYITLEDVANIIILVAPGYFAIRAYSLIYSKQDKEYARLLIESAIFSVPIVSAYNVLWRFVAPNYAATATSARYVLPLLLLSTCIGWAVSAVRKTRVANKLAQRLRLPGPDEDFIRMQFEKLKHNEPVTVVLKNDAIFSGTPQGGNTFRNGYPRQYYFNNIAWYAKRKKGGSWEERDGSLIIDLGEVRFIETSQPLPRD